jgi:lysine 6-dehydrogenase
MAFRYEGRVPTMEYKTLRYPGHAALMESIRDLGLLDLIPVDVKGHHVVPRDAFIATVGPRLRKANGHDLVALRVSAQGTKGGKPKSVEWELLDYFDTDHGISAMERTTGYSLAITGMMQVRQQVAGAGVLTPDEAVPPALYVSELAKRAINIRQISS